MKTKNMMLAIAAAAAECAIGATVSVNVDVSRVLAEVPRTLYGTGMEDVNHEIYGGLDAQRLYDESFEETEPAQLVSIDRTISGAGFKCCGRQWNPIVGGGGLEFVDSGIRHLGRRSQVLMPNGGIAGVWNAGLNCWGINCREGKPLDGHIFVRGHVTRLEVSLQRADGKRTYAASELKFEYKRDWQRLDFTLIPRLTDPQARFTIAATGEGKVWLDDAYLADRPTNEFGRLGCREDLVEGFRRERLTFLRWGGSMSNCENLLFRNMKGDRAPYDGYWFGNSSTGFLYKEYAEMANAMKLPFALSIFAYETVEEAVKVAEWLKKFEVDVYVEIGNEECAGLTPTSGKRDDMSSIHRYCESLRKLVPAMRAVNPRLKFVNAIMWFRDSKSMPFLEEGFRLTDGYCEYWDIHVGNDCANAFGSVSHALTKFRDMVRRLNPKSTMKAAIFEENGRSHGMKRALGHASGLVAARTFGDFLLTSCPANALQPYGHNDNGWDQGQIFFTPEKVWLQPYGWAQQMASANHRDLLVASTVSDSGIPLSATCDRDKKSVVLHFVNPSDKPKHVKIDFAGGRKLSLTRVTSLSAPTLDAHNPPDDPERISPREVTAAFRADSTLVPYSYVIVEYREEK